MKTATLFLSAIAYCVLVSPTYALWSVADEGTWPKSWPEELEPLRKQARSLTGGLVNLTVYEIPFTDREEFEAAWPHILKIKSPGAPIILVRGSKERYFGAFDAGVLIRRPPHAEDRAVPAEPLPGDRPVRQRWMKTTFIELIVDGDVVDLNRIPLPEDTPIVDERQK